MNIAVLGTGIVGRTIAGKLGELGHAVRLGTRNVDSTRNTPASDDAPSMSEWLAARPRVTLANYEAAAVGAELVINATNGASSLDALEAVGAANLAGRILIDVSNPLDFSGEMPPVLSVCNTDSLGEQIQRAFPDARVVKTLNTVTASLMVDPRRLADGDHSIFVSGNDADAKATVITYLKEWFGWKDVLDLGDITTARGAEMYLPLWLRLWGVVGSASFSVKVVSG